MKYRTKNIYNLIFFTLLTIIFLLSCKKKDERDLIKNYIGIYSVTQISSVVDGGQLVSTQKQIELDVKRSCNGIKIKGVKDLDNFDVNSIDSTFSAQNTKEGESAYGKFHPNDSISFTVYLSDKLPITEFYKMKKK